MASQASLRSRVCGLLALPTRWEEGDKAALDWKTLVQISRPGWYLVHVWLYLAPTGQHYELLTTWAFWLGLVYVLFPLNLLVYGLNDYTDVDLDANNERKGNFMYGAKCSKEQVRDLPRIIVFMNDIPLAPMGFWAHMSCLVLRTQLWTEFLDYEPDSACSRRTTSTLLGKTLSKAMVVVLLVLEAVVTWYFFEDMLMRLFSFSGIVAFVSLEVVRGTSDREKKKAMKAQNALGMSLVFWIWYRGIFAA